MSFDAIIARTEANRAAGISRVYPEHAGKSRRPRKVPARALPPAVRRSHLKFDHTNLFPAAPGLRFNTALTARGDGYVIAWRTATAKSDVYAGRLDKDFNPVGEAVKLALDHPGAAGGREDPRFFVHNDALHVSFVGVETGDHGVRTNVLYARLGDDLEVEAVFDPHYRDRNYWEKNWSFFSSGGELYAVYGVTPHRVLKIAGDHAESVAVTRPYAKWAGGEIRGGASPVLHAGMWWHFTHSSESVGAPGGANDRRYSVGVYAFEAKPPFRIVGMAEEPILLADEASRPGGFSKSVIFPCGAVRKDAGWLVTSGVHDRWTEAHWFGDADLAGKMTWLLPPDWWSYDRGSWDEAAWADVVSHDAYKLAGLDLDDAAVLDVGAHVGTFAYRARRRGAALVHCYEPEPASLAHLTTNAAALGKVVPFGLAIGEVVGTWFRAETEVENQPAAIGLDAAILALAGDPRNHSGRVNLLKLDCERGEWSALTNVTRLDLVDRVIGEWHRAQWNGREWGPDDLTDLLTAHGFEVTVDVSAVGCGLFSAVRA